MELLGALQQALGHRFRVTAEVARGGAAAVFRAEPSAGGEAVAIKLLYPDLAWGPAGRRFVREMAILQGLRHPGIVPLLEAGVAEVVPGALVPWFAMPYWTGRSLKEVLGEGRPVPVAQAVGWIRGVGAALGYAHARGIVHRDLKPGNILVAGAEAVLADFGVARAVVSAGGVELTSAGVVVGTPEYMSPEQAAGHDRVDAQSDVYALGIVAYEVLTGELPFTRGTPQAILAKQLRAPVLPVRILRPEVPEAVEAVVMRWLAKEPAARGELGAGLAGLLV